ncbi:MAG: ArsR family transcriptional regulator, partial [Enterococcus sp.]|nr:ArsR family transcriptional regulator [Enterococcus sp.]
LKILKQAKLIDCRSEGTKNYYSLSHDTTKIEQLQQLLTHITSIMPGRKQA